MPDPAARLAALYDDVLPVVFGYCRARLSEADAEDVTSEVFRAALEQLRRDPQVELQPSWFVTTARNRIIDRWRSQIRWAPRLRVVAASSPATTEGPGEQSTSDVLDALDRLPPHQRAAVVLHHVDGLPVQDVAGLLGRSPVAVESLLARARRAMARALVVPGEGDR